MLLQMIQNMYGQQVMERLINSILSKFKFMTLSVTHFLEMFTAHLIQELHINPNTSVDYVNTWIFQNSYPVLNVSLNKLRMTITQDPFYNLSLVENEEFVKKYR